MKPIKIKLEKERGDILPCKSKWWGSPDMPSCMTYPSFKDSYGNDYPYNFICQIRLEELAEVFPHNGLPACGMLYFFAKLDYFLGRDVPQDEIPGCTIWDKDCIKVIYIKEVDEANFIEHQIVTDDDFLFSPAPRKIEFTNGTTDDAALLAEHQLLGKPCGMPYADWDTPCEGWQLLLQVDSDEDDDFILRFMDMGLLYFLISPKDLRKEDFSKVRATMISS